MRRPLLNSRMLLQMGDGLGRPPDDLHFRVVGIWHRSWPNFGIALIIFSRTDFHRSQLYGHPAVTIADVGDDAIAPWSSLAWQGKQSGLRPKWAMFCRRLNPLLGRDDNIAILRHQLRGDDLPGSRRETAR